MKRAWPYAVLAVVAMVGVALSARGHRVRAERDGAEWTARVRRAHAAARDARAPSVVQRADRVASLPPLPRTMRDVPVDGGFVVDGDGHLVASESALQLFQFFFSASGLESDDVILARIVQEIRARLVPPAEGEALALLERFVGYRAAGKELAEELEDASADERVDALMRLRREAFGERDAAQMFERDEQVRAVHMERARIMADESLDERERAQLLDAAEQALPEGMRERRAQSTAALRTYEAVEAMRAQGASDAEVQAVRAQNLGDEAAARLAQVDVEERAFRAALEEIEVRAASTPAGARTSALEPFIVEHFAERDRARARALLAAGFPAR